MPLGVVRVGLSESLSDIESLLKLLKSVIEVALGGVDVAEPVEHHGPLPQGVVGLGQGWWVGLLPITEGLDRLGG